MWAQRLIRPGVFETTDAPTPTAVELSPGEVLLRTLAWGICGSDLPSLNGQKNALTGVWGEFLPGRPGFPMHEVVGEVVASRHRDVEPASRVVGRAVNSDAIAEYVVTDGDQVNVYDSSIDPLPAVLIQSLACVRYALGRVPVEGKDVVVLGIGPIGALFAHVAKDRGARRVTGVDPIERASLSPLLGFDETTTTTSGIWAKQLAESEQPQVTIEAVGHQIGTLGHAVASTAPDGTILYFGIPDDDVYPINMESLMRKNLTLVGGGTRKRRRALADGNEYLLRHRGLHEALV